MNLEPFQILPHDFFVEDDVRGNNATATIMELLVARDKAIANPGQYVLVGSTRFLKKDCSAWCSEVNTGKKAALDNPKYDGKFHARWWVHSDEVDVDGNHEYGKAIAFFPYKEEM